MAQKFAQITIEVYLCIAFGKTTSCRPFKEGWVSG